MAMTRSIPAPQCAGTESAIARHRAADRAIGPDHRVSMIALSLGEPQHPYPILSGLCWQSTSPSSPLSDFTRSRAVPALPATVFPPDSPCHAAVDPESVDPGLEPAGEGLFRGLAAARYVGRTGGPARRILSPSILPVYMAPARVPRAAIRFTCRPRSPTDFCRTSLRSTKRSGATLRSTSPRRANPQGAGGSKNIGSHSKSNAPSKIEAIQIKPRPCELSSLPIALRHKMTYEFQIRTSEDNRDAEDCSPLTSSHIFCKSGNMEMAQARKGERVAKYAAMFSAWDEPRLRIMAIAFFGASRGLVVGDFQGNWRFPIRRSPTIWTSEMKA